MPVYLLRCKTCSHEFDNYRTVANHGSWDDCPICQGEAQQVITRPMSVRVDNMPRYVCPQTGAEITSRKKRNESFARHGLMDANELGCATGPKHQRTEAVSVDGMGAGGNLNATPSNARKMSKAEDAQLVEDIKQAIEATP